jgi:hypothetical protein
MTEDEAEKKWCPMSENGEMNRKCIGSDCMAWRATVTETTTDGSGIRMEGDPIIVIVGGFCGLAGKP